MRTKGKLTFEKNGYGQIIARVQDNKSVIILPGGFPGIHDPNQDDAQHIVSCWNAFEPDGLVDKLVGVCAPLLEAYCNMAQMLQTDQQFMGDQLTQQATKALALAKESRPK